MIGHLIKITIFTTTLVLFGALEQRPLWALSNTYVSATSLENTDDSTETTNSTNYYYRPNSLTEQFPTVSSAPLSSYTPAYTNRWARLSSTLPQRRKVPEPSMLLGLMAIAASLRIQHQMKKKLVITNITD